MRPDLMASLDGIECQQTVLRCKTHQAILSPQIRQRNRGGHLGSHEQDRIRVGFADVGGTRMDVFLVHILSPEELEPKLVGDLKLVDCEDGDVRELSVSAPILQRYQQALNAFVEQAKTFCNRMSITYVPARSDRAADQLVNEYLRARGLVR